MPLRSSTEFVDHYNQCILCGNRLRFMSAEKGIHAVTLLSERRDKMVKKRWLQTAA
ncbi:hypothetical protein QE197_20140 (plasmid) [Arsenophonus nasoniae]|uniref:Uncharacterized protein n=1 Tax=Arsenophonus nasoniae TaxID=638 RepID=A0ABY8NXX2_9GAMM|nr:hypothetical protein [Arsenophonus nasoniae]WGM08119.1 hypothetical protein QE258_21565 [Arsenophonus nasoniae]WGM12987.1 hypothetical protein QE197_20140 [Arsenophonus nasoniae]WGM17453.1 hypothetical protein QE193_20310 [Arsenophonus nasoniae]